MFILNLRKAKQAAPRSVTETEVQRLRNREQVLCSKKDKTNREVNELKSIQVKLSRVERGTIAVVPTPKTYVELPEHKPNA